MGTSQTVALREGRDATSVWRCQYELSLDGVRKLGIEVTGDQEKVGQVELACGWVAFEVLKTLFERRLVATFSLQQLCYCKEIYAVWRAVVVMVPKHQGQLALASGRLQACTTH